MGHNSKKKKHLNEKSLSNKNIEKDKNIVFQEDEEVLDKIQIEDDDIFDDSAFSEEEMKALNNIFNDESVGNKKTKEVPIEYETIEIKNKDDSEKQLVENIDYNINDKGDNTTLNKENENLNNNENMNLSNEDNLFEDEVKEGAKEFESIDDKGLLENSIDVNTEKSEANDNVVENTEVQNDDSKDKEEVKEEKKVSFFEKLKQKFVKKDNAEEDISVAQGSVSSDSFEKTDLSEADIKAQEAAKQELIEKKKKRNKTIRLVIIVIAFIAFMIFLLVFLNKKNKQDEEKKELMKNTQQVRIMNIQSELSGSGTLLPKDSYTITALVEGNVMSANFEIGDIVEKDQLLYEIESGTAYRSITNASSSLAQAKDNYQKAKTDYEKSLADFKDNIYHSQFTGTIKDLKIKEGSIIGANTEICTIVNDKYMSVKAPFLAIDANTLKVGQDAILVLSDTDEGLVAKIENIDKEASSYKNGSQVKYVKVKCENPGGLTTERTAQIYAGNVASVGDGSFEVDSEEKITVGEGNNLEIEKIIAQEGKFVSKGDPLFKISDKSILNATASKKNSFLQAEASLQKAESSLDDAIDAFDEYYIKAPIKGTIITKDVKVGDKIQRNTSNTKTLATIYDLSELKFDMDVDELDISKVKSGQEVEVEADAFGNKRFKGIITNVSLVSQSQNGVSNYPVTVTLYETGGLLPGMNVEGYVILQKAENCLGVPADALQRGNVLYLTNDSPSVVNKKIITEGISDRIKNNTPIGFTATKVVTGVTNEDFIEIKEGAQEGDKVYVKEKTTGGGFGFGGYGGGGGRPGGGGNRR